MDTFDVDTPLHDTPPARDVPDRRALNRRFAANGVRSVGFSVLIAAGVSLGLAKPFATALVYGLCIGPLCWLLVDGGRIAVARGLAQREGVAEAGSAWAGDWPGWRWMLALIVAGTSAAVALGTALADRITGLQTALRWAPIVWTLSLLLSAAIAYFFESRSRIAAGEAKGEAARRQAAEAQLRLLHAQLEPHMLFNTLANVHALIGIDPPRAQHMLDRLIDFLRTTLGASRATLHPLSVEFQWAKDYLALMQTRMGSRLRTQFDVPAALAAVEVPPLLLQPLVENAVKHGLEPKVGGGLLAVSAMVEDGQLVLRVRDSGVGMPGSMAPGTHFGLQHTRARLATLYGNAATLQVERVADADGGTLATIRLPGANA